MFWTDLELERLVSDEQLRAAFAQSFGVREHAVNVIGEIWNTDPWKESETRIVVKRSRQAGDFPLHLRVVLGSPALDDLVVGDEREQAMAQRLAELLRTRLLMSDDDVSPYSWNLVTPGQGIENVHVDADRLDDDDAFVLCGPAHSPRESSASNEALARG